MSTDRDKHFEPGKLWSLLDLMYQIPIADLMLLDVTIASEMTRYDHKRAEMEIGQNAVTNIAAILKSFEAVGATGDFTPTTYDLIMKARQRLRPDLKNGVAYALLNSIHEAFHSELSRKGCFLLDKEEMAYANQAALFGEAVRVAFPSAAMDIREIGNCFAAERYNATAYHCTQAAEIGLRALAKDRRVQPIKYGKKTPLDQSEWGDVIKGLRDAFDDIKAKWPKGEAKDFAQVFYEQSIIEVTAINDGWRRHLSHARSHQYARDDVLGLIGHVRRLLQRIAPRLGEDRTPTPVIWQRVPVELRS